jgi:hypothetical protein
LLQSLPTKARTEPQNAIVYEQTEQHKIYQALGIQVRNMTTRLFAICNLRILSPIRVSSEKVKVNLAVEYNLPRMR